MYCGFENTLRQSVRIFRNDSISLIRFLVFKSCAFHVHVSYRFYVCEILHGHQNGNLYIVLIMRCCVKKMAKKCIYCNVQIDENSVVDVCQRCGIGVWGEKMFGAILENMTNARESGDLYQGSVSQTFDKPKKEPVNPILVQDHDTLSENLERKKALESSRVEVTPIPQSEPFSSQRDTQDRPSESATRPFDPDKKEERPHKVEILSSSNEVNVVPKSDDILGSLN